MSSPSRRIEPLLLLDRQGLRLLLRTGATPAGRVAVALSHLGRGGAPWFALTAAIGSGKSSLCRRDAVLAAAGATGSALALSALVARLVQRPRPCDRGVRPLIPCPKGGSFPSDQAAAAFAAAGILGRLEPGARPWLRRAAALVAVSRVVVGAHYPTDVLAGAAIGAGLGRGAAAVATRLSASGD